MARYVRPGKQLTGVISSARGGAGEKVLEAMVAMASDPGPRGRCMEFSGWKESISSREGQLSVRLANGETRNVTLKSGAYEGVFLADTPGLRKFSLRFQKGDGVIILPVPLHFANKGDGLLRAVAGQALAAVLRGEGWTDRDGRVHQDACGDPYQPHRQPQPGSVRPAPEHRPYFVR